MYYACDIMHSVQNCNYEVDFMMENECFELYGNNGEESEKQS